MSRLWAALLAGLLLTEPAAASGTLRIGMQDDPELLDPARSGGLPNRTVLAALCGYGRPPTGWTVLCRCRTG